MADTKISALPAQTTGNGSEIMLAVDSGANVKITTDQVADYSRNIWHPGYVSGRYYQCYPSLARGAAVLSFNANTIYFFPFRIWHSVTISNLGAYINNGFAASTIQMGLYANSSSLGRPTGAVLGKTGDVSSAASGAVNGALSGGNITISPGIYWFGVIGTSTSIRLGGGNLSEPFMAPFIGTTTQARSIAGSQIVEAVTITDTYGTWATQNGTGFSEFVATANSAPNIQFKVA